MVSVYTEVEVDVDLDDLDTEDLIEELERRGKLPVESGGDAEEILEEIWLRRRNGQDYDYLVDQLIYKVLGKVI